jgi:hypothetical protein
MCELLLKTPLQPLPVGVSLSSDKRREALNLAPLPYKGRGWGLGLRESCTSRYLTRLAITRANLDGSMGLVKCFWNPAWRICCSLVSPA